MAEEIINRVANSKLITIDLEDYYPKGARVQFDIKDWLFHELVLKEKDFREYVKNHDWSQYQNQYVAIHCSVDAIIPDWAFMLLTVNLEPFVEKCHIGTLEDLETAIYQDIITNIDATIYQDKPVIIKGCSNKPVPINAYVMITNKLKPYAKNIMYGEACSFVPLYKR
ncbi:DUF2480 family protein [Olleya aquimaris]|uniref:DUF2480 family protein n=1 Tax=Olleya sediminilitoris TaxID=2795739 RepID=A0ABS1WNC7_9FLAO|nr:DUF2480 family protein [Olleya sediminilitoris]AXO80923.1 DUF2480 family protein [Olleya aquimaris]MBL7560639.1 DUF2480 family protein [Olleya sediminilitoris]